MSGRAWSARTGQVDVPLPVGQALPLFTPEGERQWVPGWAPTYPAGGIPDLAAGVAFQTETEHGTANWVVSRWEPEAGRAAYVAVVAGFRATHVEIHVEPTVGGSRVEVTYRMTALSPEADTHVQAFDAGYGAMMEGWARLIAGALEVGAVPDVG